ncbi:phospholipid transporter [Nadsonia fulvescens var. elongata DSM 6958]|uniref:Phospholipid transporter n=1 Tax=Nadsonia fulvescens var. elongata DSM 6958 TaxID=857566 RepID=A0A1E3PGN2_9ASCO|nr:phospholipid transporter [Nadsonia fulvescens var. elongata DSM 6958]
MHLPWEHKNEIDESDLDAQTRDQDENYNVTQKTRGEKLWPVVAAGAGLFSDGYVNNSIGTASTCLKILYPKEYANSPAQSNVASIAFAGTVLGQLVFGYVADYHSRKIGMLISMSILVLFTILASGAWGAGGSISGMLAALTVYRFFIGIGIGGEYPAGSVACAEASAIITKGSRNRYFILFTNFMIDWGFVISAFVPLVCLWIFGKDNLNPVWRLTIGLGAIPPLSLFYLRFKFEEPEQFEKLNMKKAKVPYTLIIKYYWWRLTVVSTIWFIYDFSVYAFGIYSSTILNRIIPDHDIYKTFGWNVVMNFFYIPGSFLGAFASDNFGPRTTLVVGLLCQSVMGFFMAGFYGTLEKNVAAFTVIYGIFLSFGEFGPGNNSGLLAAKSSATPVRGQFYGLAAAIAKVGAFIGTYIFPIIIKNAGGEDTVKGNQAPFWVAGALCIFSAFVAFFLLPPLGQDALDKEDVDFCEYLAANGYSVSQLGSVSSTKESIGSNGDDSAESESKGPMSTVFTKA